MTTYFHCESVAENVTKIEDPAGVYAYLVEGQHQAALLDTCCGVGNLKEFVESLTQKPIIVLCTHGHLDHAGGTFGFDTVYLSKKDEALANWHTTIDLRQEYVETKVEPGTISKDLYVPQRDGGYLDFCDGQVFDLGGITLEAIALPGHTQGTICILIRELRCLLLGDGCNIFTCLFMSDSTSIEEYKSNLQQLLLKHEDRYDTVWFSHGISTGDKMIVNDCIEVCHEIMAGKADNIPFTFLGFQVLIAKAMNEDFSRVDGKAGNIAYVPEKVYSEHP